MLMERMGSIMKCWKKSVVFCLMAILEAGLTACGGDKKEKEEEKVLFDSVKYGTRKNDMVCVIRANKS